MRILVCVKQVPDTAEIKIDPETNNLCRQGVPSIVNLFDLYALETAVRLKEANPGTDVTVLSMGPRQAETALRQCLAAGADDAVLVSGRVFAGSDTLATSYALSKAIRFIEAEKGPFDLILCGMQAIDGDTAQTGPALAEHLNYPQITCVKELYLRDGGLRAIRETERGPELWETPLPAVVTITKPDFEPRRPTVGAKLAAKRAVIRVLSIEDIQAEPECCGLRGSPTVVRKTFTVPPKAGRVIIQEANAHEAAAKLAAFLVKEGLV